MNSLSGLSIHCYPELEGHELFGPRVCLCTNCTCMKTCHTMTLLSQKICRINASLWAWFFFLNQPHQEHVTILLVGSVNVKLASWAHSWWYEMALTCLRLFVMRSFTVVIQTFLLCFSFFLSPVHVPQEPLVCEAVCSLAAPALFLQKQAHGVPWRVSDAVTPQGLCDPQQLTHACRDDLRGTQRDLRKHA